MVGIISWLPSEEIANGVRYWRMRQVLSDLKILYPKEKFVLIAQDYTDEQVSKIDTEVDVRRFGKLGIVGARNMLRQVFLDSNEPYIMMYDDDCELSWLEDNAGQKTIECLLNNKYGVVFQCTASCKNVGYKRHILEAIQFRKYNGHDYFEDQAFWDDLITYLGVDQNYRVLFSECMRSYILDRSPYDGEKYRTWKVDQ